MKKKINRKPFKTIGELIELLKSRNVLVLDEVEAKRYLLGHSYYAVINGYRPSMHFAPDTENPKAISIPPLTALREGIIIQIVISAT